MRRAASAALLVLAAAAAPARADDAPAELDLFQLDAALAKETTIASRKPRTVRESPGIVTVVTRDEILASGARDLADVLAGVPGFQLAVDVDSVLGAGFRGLWGQEGKILVLLDGIEMNDLLWGAVPLGNHFLVDEVERVEVIRGPGSVVHGGNAELAVVNVVTRGLDRSGAALTASAGRMEGAFSAGTATLAVSGGEGALRASVAASGGVGQRSDGTYRDLSGAAYDMAGDSGTAPVQINAGLRWRDLSARVVYDDYRHTYRDGYGDVLPAAVEQRFRTAAVDARWALRAGDRLVVTPRLAWKRQVPWQVTDVAADPDSAYDVTAERAVAGVTASWDPGATATFVAGVEGLWDRAWSNQPDLEDYDFDGRRDVSYATAVAFAEAGVDTPAANFLVGARWEHHSEFGSAFVPRVALTRLAGAFHLKLLASGAFRAPSIEHLHYGDELRPEKTRVFEAEVGWQRGPLYVAANVFDLAVERPIVFGLDDAGVDAYVNGGRTGSAGVEGEVRLAGRHGLLAATYAHYDAAGRNRVESYEVGEARGRLLGFAGHTVGARGQLRLPRRIVLASELRWLSSRYAVTGLDADDAPVVGRLGSRAVVNLFASWQPEAIPGLELGAGVRDVLDAGTVYPQPYASGGHAPLPGASREIGVRVRFEQPLPGSRRAN